MEYLCMNMILEKYFLIPYYPSNSMIDCSSGQAAHAMGVITDSGNVAEEATFNGVPCITLKFPKVAMVQSPTHNTWGGTGGFSEAFISPCLR